jgi:hypothetical protein
MRFPTEANLRRSATLRGRPKSLEMRAALHASRYVNRRSKPRLWQKLFDARMVELRQRAQVLEFLRPEERAS